MSTLRTLRTFSFARCRHCGAQGSYWEEATPYQNAFGEYSALIGCRSCRNRITLSCRNRITLTRRSSASGPLKSHQKVFHLSYAGAQWNLKNTDLRAYVQRYCLIQLTARRTNVNKSFCDS